MERKQVAQRDGLVYLAAEGSDKLSWLGCIRMKLNRIDAIAFATETREEMNTQTSGGLLVRRQREMKMPLSKWLIGGAIAALASVAAGAQNRPDIVAATPEAASPRQTVILADGWRFKQDDKVIGAERVTFVDAAWPIVSVPHSWNRVGNYLPQVPSRLNDAASTNKTQGVGWYRLSFDAPKNIRGKRVWLEFDAASRVASVWLNGKLIGEHQGGFSRFRLDATTALKADGPNLLAVRTDNAKPALGSATADVLPLFGDFFVPGGLYRPVRLIVTDPVHFDMLDAGGPGVYATTRTVAADKAMMDVTLKLRNDAAQWGSLRVVTKLFDAAGQVAAQKETSVRIKGASTIEIPEVLEVARPHLWQGVDDPYLYTLSVEVLGRDGRVLDRTDQSFGIRQMRFDAKQGFFLNGKPYILRGVGYHQDREDKGWALDARDVEGDVKLLRDMGATSIRLTHYQHGQPIHDLADRYGLILWDELPLVSAWTLGDATQATPGLRQNARQQLSELIRQNQNHPSVAVWSIANEVDFGNSLPGFIGSGKVLPNPMPLLAELNLLAKSFDPSRPTALANCCEGRLFKPGVEVPVTASAVDLGGSNRYFGWYYGQPSDLGGNLDALHAARPEQPLSVTEYGAGGALTIHTDNVLGGPVDSRGRVQPEEFESYVHEQNWAVLSTKPYLWATWLWSAFDFASTIRHEGDADDINTKGLIAYDHKTTKDAYYFYRANWSTNPTVHVNGRRYVNRAYRVTDVRVNSNAPLTELLVNGISAGSRSACNQKVCVWSGVTLREGDNTVSARGMFPGRTVEDSVGWKLSADAARSTRIDSGALMAGRSDERPFGSDNFFDGGAAGTVVAATDYGNPAKNPVISGTRSAAVAATYREGEFHYRVPLTDGRYAVTLTFVEPSVRSGERQFDVLAGGRVRIQAFDPAKAGAGITTAVQRRFAVAVRDGRLDLWFRPKKGRAIVSAVEIEPVPK